MLPDHPQHHEKAIGIFVASARAVAGALPAIYDDLLAPDGTRRAAAAAAVHAHFSALPGPLRSRILHDATQSARRQAGGFATEILARKDELTLDDLFPKF